jgi:aminoglycoside phosphotransferase (APT) family kinase protein
MRREQGASALLRKAEAAVAAATQAGERTGFVHGDLWHGNTMWDGGALTAVIDWDCAGVGPAGVDLGSLRCDAALCHGLDAAGPVRSGFEAEAGRMPPAMLPTGTWSRHCPAAGPGLVSGRDLREGPAGPGP